MKNTLRLIGFACIAVVHSLLNPLYAQVSFGRAEKFNNDWKFMLEAASDELRVTSEIISPTFDDSKWRKLDLPHDWSIEGLMSPTLASCTGYLPGGIGWYRKTFEVNDQSKRHYIYFEGIYNRSEVYLNGRLLGKRPNGYISFMYDLTPHLRPGENVLAVRVDHSRYADSRWYTGSGIYRDVWMVEAGDIHFAQWGVGWKATKISDAQATVQVDMEVFTSDELRVTSGKPAACKVRATMYDAEGKQVAVGSKSLSLATSSTYKQTIDLRVRKPKRWDLDTPYLYILKTEILADGQVVDSSTCRVGLRTLQFDADKGFALNGRWMKVKGVCLHHDAGVLGSVVPRDVWCRRLLNLKEIGVNAIRMSHNPQAPDVYDLCDELGLMVMDEASDEWEFPKRKWMQGWNVGTPSFDGSFDFFEEWIEQDVTDMVRRDRNHPSIILWSIGNEVDYPNDPYSHPVLDGTTINQPMFGGYKPDAPDAMRIGEIAKRLAARVREVDTSRPVTGALAGVVMSNQTAYPGAIDVVGYNYTENRYDEDHATYPDRIIYGSETHASYEAWKAVRDRQHIFGQFIWTGLDYLGESGRWPSRGLHTGLLDFGGFKKPRGWFRASLWSEKPVTYIGTYPLMRRRGGGGNYLSMDAPDLWNYREGQPVRVVCYTNSPQARLLLDGEVVGEMKAYNDTTGIIHWDIPYRPGRLVAEGCNASGEVESTYAIETSGRPYALRVRQVMSDELQATSDELQATSDKCHPDGSLITRSSSLVADSLVADSLVARSSSLVTVLHFLIEVIDEEGRPVKLADNMVTCYVQGPARLLGLENSDNTDMTDHRDNRQRVCQGRLLAYVQTTGEEGTVRIYCTSPLLKDGMAEVEVALPRREGTIAPGKLWPDTDGVHINAHGGGVLYHQGTYYWYGEHKSAHTSKAEVGVMCYSSENLTEWKNEGAVLPVSDDPESVITAGCVMERPKVIYNEKTGKFVLWFHLELKDRGYAAARAAVAVSDSPTGPFRLVSNGRINPGKLPLNLTEAERDTLLALNPDDYPEWWTPAWRKAIGQGLFVKRDLEGGQMSRDMTLFVDDDGKAYHIYSSEDNLTLHIAELADDYLSHTGRYVRLAPAGHNEAPAIFKRNGKYWMITSGCTGWDPNEARMFSADHIFGPWMQHPNPCVGLNARLTFGGQSTFILPVHGRPDSFIFMADQWRPRRHIDGRYVWLPIRFREDGTPFIEWMDAWSPSLLP